MRQLKRSFSRIGNLLGGKRGELRLREEIELHLSLETEANLRAGMKPEEARRRAMIKFGAVEAVREDYHAEGGFPFIEELVQDTRYGLRTLRKSPRFTAVAIITLALGIGANAAIFTLVNAILLRKLPVADPKSLVQLGDKAPCCVEIGVEADGDYGLFSTESYRNLRQSIPEFTDLAAMQAGFAFRPVTALRNGTRETAHSVMGEFVSGNYFRTFGLNAAAGRLLMESDDVPGAPMTAVMSFETWKNMYNRDYSVVGSTFKINTRPVTIVGIAPEGYFGDRVLRTPPEFYLPVETMTDIGHAPYARNSERQWLYLVGRVRPGVSIKQLQQKVNTILIQQLRSTPHYSTEEAKLELKKAHVVLSPGGGGIQAMQRQYNEQLLLMMSASGLLLLIACANIANLLLVRGVGRKAEINLRAALGAHRGRIARQLLTESLLLAGLGGLAGLAVAYGGTRILLALAFPGAQHIPVHASPSPEVLAFAFGLSLLTGLLFGVAPTLVASRADPAESLRSGARSVAGGATTLQLILVVAQAALSLVLLVSAGLFTQSLNKLEHLDLKLQTNNRYIAHIKPQSAGYSQIHLGELYRSIEERFGAIPGVAKVGIASYTPMEDDYDGWSVVVQGKPDPHASSAALRASPDYFESVGTHLLMGRGIEVTDTPISAKIAVVNQSFVKKFFKPGENPIGQHFGGDIKSADNFQIVGVVEDTAYTDARWKGHPMFFAPLPQRVASDTQPIDKDESLYSGGIVIETSHPIPELESLTRKTLAEINPNLALVKFQTFTAQIADQFSDQRMLAQLTSMFGILALLLAALGLYGVTAYMVVRRTAEIGIRMALGAPRVRVIAMVMRGVILQTLIALAVGVPVAMICVRYLRSQLYEISSVGPGVMVGSIVVLMAAAFVAGTIPARKAASINPAETLKAE